MQSEHSSSLKAGSTKNKQSQKGGVTSHVRYLSFYSAKKVSEVLRRPWVELKPVNQKWTVMWLWLMEKSEHPSRTLHLIHSLITKAYKEYTEEYLKLLEQQQ